MTFRAKALRRELVVGSVGETMCVFIQVNTKTSRDKKANQMDFIKTKCKQRNVKYNTLHNIIPGKETNTQNKKGVKKPPETKGYQLGRVSGKVSIKCN